VLTDDPVTDFMVMEAVSLKAAKEDRKEREEQQRREWRSTKNKESFANLDKFR
jgi:hypothetical protein